MTINIRRRALSGACVLGCLLAGPLYADTAVEGGTFVTNGQSIWSSGASFQSNYSASAGISVSGNPSIGGVDCSIVGCYGADAGLNLSGSVGINVGAHVDSGTVNAAVPFNSAINYQSTLLINTSFTPSYSIGLGSGNFHTTAPNVGAYADLTASLNASAYADICVVECASTSGTIVNASGTQELAAFNRNNDGQLRILGGNVGLSGSIGPTSWTFQVPTGANGAGSTHLAGNASADVIKGGLDVAGVVGDALGVPLSGSIGPISWSLISASATLDTYFNQQFGLDPNVFLDHLYVEQTGQTIPCFGGVCGAIIGTGLGDLTVDPFYMINASFSNTTGIQFAPGYDLSILSASISGVGSLGPVFDTNQNFPLPQVNLYSNTFGLFGWNSIEGRPFNVEVVPEPGTLGLLGLAMTALFVWLRRRGVVRNGAGA